MSGRLTTVLLSAVVVVVSSHAAFAREWRGIVPLRATGADVMRLLDQCAKQREACRFSTPNEDVHILFSAGLTTNDRDCATALRPETVMFIAVRPLAKLRLRDLGVGKRTLRCLKLRRKSAIPVAAQPLLLV